MSAIVDFPFEVDTSHYDRMADALVDKGYLVTPSFVPQPLAEGLLQEVLTSTSAEFKPAAIGRESQEQRNSFVRSDAIHWLTGTSESQRQFLGLMQGLRDELNRRLFLGLFDYECHYAHYRAGDFYKKHYDAFKGKTNRVLSTVLYLNPGWLAEDGGELLVYDREQTAPFLKVTPLFGQMIIFLSERFPHEVLAAKRDRYSIAGWFRVNTSIGGTIDPPR